MFISFNIIYIGIKQYLNTQTKRINNLILTSHKQHITWQKGERERAQTLWFLIPQQEPVFFLYPLKTT